MVISIESHLLLRNHSEIYRRAGQRCFGLLALISRTRVRYIYLPERMILPGSLIPSDKCILLNLTFVIRIQSCVYCLRHRAGQILNIFFISKYAKFFIPKYAGGAHLRGLVTGHCGQHSSEYDDTSQRWRLASRCRRFV